MFTLTPGTAPLLVSFPHAGTEIPNALAARMTPEALQRADVDWHLPQLYAFARALGASTLVARFARHVVDLNRPPEDTSLYPGQDVTGLLPLDTFRKEPLYRPGEAPGRRRGRSSAARRYWQPVPRRAARRAGRLRRCTAASCCGTRTRSLSVMPRFFDGKLPDLNLGTADGRAARRRCRPRSRQRAGGAGGSSRTCSNGRFKGGYITRHYGQPARGVHALQLEMCQSTYMDETAPFGYRRRPGGAGAAAATADAGRRAGSAPAAGLSRSRRRVRPARSTSHRHRSARLPSSMRAVRRRQPQRLRRVARDAEQRLGRRHAEQRAGHVQHQRQDAWSGACRGCSRWRSPSARRAGAAASIGGSLRLAQEVERAGQQHRDGAGARHRAHAGLVDVLEVVGRQRAELAPRARRRRWFDSCSACSLTGRPCARAASNTRRVCAGVKRDRSRRTRRPRRRGQRARPRAGCRSHDLVDVGVGAAGELGRQRVRGRAAWCARRPGSCSPSARATRSIFSSVSSDQAVAGLDLDRGHAVAHQRVAGGAADCASSSSSVGRAGRRTVETMPPPARAISS